MGENEENRELTPEVAKRLSDLVNQVLWPRMALPTVKSFYRIELRNPTVL